MARSHKNSAHLASIQITFKQRLSIKHNGNNYHFDLYIDGKLYKDKDFNVDTKEFSKTNENIILNGEETQIYLVTQKMLGT